MQDIDMLYMSTYTVLIQIFLLILLIVSSKFHLSINNQLKVNIIYSADFITLFVGDYHQFDTMIYPAQATIPQEESYFERGKAFFKGLFGLSSGPGGKNVDPHPKIVQMPTMEETRRKCLDVYFEDYVPLLETGIIDKNPIELIEDIAHMHACLCSPIIHDGNNKSYHHTRVWKFYNLRNVCHVLYIL